MSASLLAVLLAERFAFPDWWTRPTYGDKSNSDLMDELQAKRNYKTLAAVVDDVEGHVTCGLPDQNEEVA